LEGRPFWMLGMASLALASALRAQPGASLAWGIALLFSGSVLFLTSARHPNLLFILILGLLGFSGLPFTPAWGGLEMYSGDFSIWLLFLPLAHAFLLAGYIRHSLRPGERLEGVERWVWVIYPLGLLVLPIAHFLAAWWGGNLINENLLSFSWLQLIPSLAALGLAAIFWRLQRSKPLWVSVASRILRPSISFGWLYKLIWYIYRGTGKIVGFISEVLEGQGGVLWAFLLLTLLMAFLVQTGLGGL